MRKVRDLLVVLTISHRAVASAEDLHVLQQQLLGVILDLEERYYTVRRSLKRSDLAVKLGQVLPEQLRDTPALAEFFALQRAIWCARRLGDSVAWKALGYDRFYFETVGLGQFQGLMWGKAGSPAEIGAFEAAWAAGTPALLHGLTTVLRTGDISVRTTQGWVPQEIKNSPTKTGSSRQKAVMRARRELLATGAGTKDGRRLIRAPSTVPFTHDLPVYAGAIERARATGAGGALIEPRGNVLALHAPTLTELPPAEAMVRVETATAANALRPFGDPPFVVRGWSEDKEANSQFGMPYTSYPFLAERLSASIQRDSTCLGHSSRGADKCPRRRITDSGGRWRHHSVASPHEREPQQCTDTAGDGRTELQAAPACRLDPS